MHSLQFRHDINALRAVAVLAVILFHYKVGIFRGGFVGVDIFFVISGYLMTAIIARRLEKGAFSVFGFYGDRARRIVPPLVGMILALLVFGYFFIDPYNYQKLASSGISALLFYSNISFWTYAGYFDAQNITKWFLHTWSLSVEWQFYILYPIVMLALYHLTTRRLWLMSGLGTIALASLAASIAFSATNPSSTFFLLPYRAWELLAGGIVALQFDNPGNRSKKISYALLAVGLALILYAVFSFDENIVWPSYWALFPVIGTSLVIAARQTEIRLFKNPACNLLGDWSYSIYLWHWPVAVAAYYLGFVNTTPVKVICQILILAALIGIGGGFVTKVQALWKERAAPKAGTAWQLPAGIATFLIALLLNVGIATDGGLASRSVNGPHLVEVYSKVKSDFNYPGTCDGLDENGALKPCRVGANADGGILFIGDSQAMQIYARFTEALAKKYKTSFTFLTAHGCAPMPGVGQTSINPECAAFVNKAFEAAKSGHYSRVVLASRWIYIRRLPNLDAVMTSFGAQLAELTKRGINVVILSATPVPDTDEPQEILRRRFFGYSTDAVVSVDRETFERDLADVKPRLKAMAAAVGATFIDPLDYLCAKNRCAMIDENGDTLFWDQSHFRGQSVKSARFKFLDDAAGLQETAQVK